MKTKMSRSRHSRLRIARLEPTTPEVITQMESVLERRFGATMHQSKVARADGVQTLIDILNRSDRATERSIFEGLESEEEELDSDTEAVIHLYSEEACWPPFEPLARLLGCQAVLLARESGGGPFDERLSGLW